MITITRAPAWLAVQDLGWAAGRAIGLPQGGALDRHALAVANLLVGNEPDLAGLESALGGGTIRFDEPTRFALAGADTAAALNGTPVAMRTTTLAAAGDLLTFDAPAGGRFLYVALAGGIEVPLVLGARATYIRGHFGGHHGRLVRSGDFLRTGSPAARLPPAGFRAPDELVSDYRRTELRVTAGPQADLFGADDRERFVATAWVVAAASDRMGYRLKGTTLRPVRAASAASDPTCAGAVQIPDSGTPIVLMADGPTVGGYPKLAVVCDTDLPLLAQRQPGEQIKFRWIAIEEAQRLHRRRRIQLHTLAALVRAAAER